MKKKLFGIAGVALLSLGLAACNNDDASTDVKEPADTTKTEQVDTNKETTTETAVQPTGNVVEATITATNFEFDTKEIQAKVGDTVKLTLKNESGLHGVALDEFGVDLKDGETIEFVVDKAGEFEFYCSILCGTGHDGMIGKLIVTE